MLTVKQETVQFAAMEAPREMREKARGRDVFFSASRVDDRPYSVYTEFMESDTEIEHGDDPGDDSEVYSEFGDLEGIEDGECSPRVSIGSVSEPLDISKGQSDIWPEYSLLCSLGNPASRHCRRTTKFRHRAHCGTARFRSTTKRSSRSRVPGGRIYSAAPCPRRNRSSFSMRSRFRPSCQKIRT
jgi:hypothetical protein